MPKSTLTIQIAYLAIDKGRRVQVFFAVSLFCPEALGKHFLGTKEEKRHGFAQFRFRGGVVEPTQLISLNVNQHHETVWAHCDAYGFHLVTLIVLQFSRIQVHCNKKTGMRIKSHSEDDASRNQNSAQIMVPSNKCPFPRLACLFVTNGVLKFPMPVRLNGQTPGPGRRPIRRPLHSSESPLLDVVLS